MTEPVRVRITTQTGAHAPVYASAGSAGADLSALLRAPIVLEPGCREKISTGIRLEIPAGWEGQVRPRSGMADRHGVTVLNTPGTIDSDYRGEIQVILINLGENPFVVANGDRIAQIVFSPIDQARFESTTSISETVRGENGFGSTGTRA